jgi:Putative restriction endonuclease
VSQKAIAAWTPEDYEQAARDYLENLPPEHFMEATPQAAQREITIESFAVLKVRLPEVHLCNELLVQYPINAHLGQVCPDNWVLIDDEPLGVMGSFNTPFETGRILWVLEYVSASNKRKDYEDNFHKYQDELKVPYYLIFDPETRDLRLYRHNGFRYEPVAPNAAGRLPVPELETEVGLLDGWARFWHEGELLPLPADLTQQLDDMQARLKQAQRQIKLEKKRADEEKKRAEEQKKRADEEKKGKRQKQRELKEAQEEIKRLRALLQQSGREGQS